MSEFKVIAASVIDPSEPGLFVKRKKSDPARFLTVSCSCESCPLLAQNACAEITIFGRGCPYGQFRDESGPTRRSAKCWDWMKERKVRHPDIGWNLSAPPNKLAFVGDYVYLPYAHANMRRDVPFLNHSGGFTTGSDFIKRDDWTLENVLKLIDFRPQALMGGEITSYQQKSVPLLIQHIRELDPEMWRQLIAVRPQYDVAPNYVGRKALLATLAHPIKLPPKHKDYQVPWEWDGKTLKTTSVHAYGSTWGGVDAAGVVVELTPKQDAAVVVSDNAWVTPDTVFVD